MPAITSANVANAIVKLVAVDALPALVGNLVMGNLVNRDYEPSLAEAGDTINVPIPPTGMVANNIPEGTGTVTTQNPNAGNAQIVLTRHKEATFKIPDVTKCLAVPDLLKLYMEPAIIALVESIETDLLSLPAQLSNNAAVGTPGTPINESALDTAETVLFNAKVPQSQQKYLVCTAADYGALRNIERFSEYRMTGQEGANAIINGELGKLKNMICIRSQYINTTTGSTPTNHNAAFAKDAFALVMRRLPKPLPGTGAIAEYAEMGNFGVRVVMSYDPNTLAQQFTVDALYGYGILRGVYGVQVYS